VEATTEQLEVVGDDDECSRGYERRERRRHGENADDPDRDRPDEAREGESDKEPVGQFGPERAAVQLVESVSGDANGEQKSGEGGDEPIDVNRGGRGGPERDVAEVPGGVGRMEQRDEVAPAAGAQRVERRPLELRPSRGSSPPL
jgi:hypothetical protein